MNWIHAWIRKNTKPIPRLKARRWFDRLSVFYFMTTWTVAGLALYSIATGTGVGLPDNLNVHAENNSENAAQRYGRVLGVTEGKVYKMKKFSVEEVVDFKTENFKEMRENQAKKEEEDFFGDAETLRE